MRKKFLRMQVGISVMAMLFLGGNHRALAEADVDENVGLQGITEAVDMETVDETDFEKLLEGITAENYPVVDGSTATLPLSAAVYQLTTGSSQKETDQAIVHTKTTNSWMRLIEDEVDLLIVADKNEKVDEAIAQSGAELEIKPIALDAFIFMANEDNPVKSLTQDEIVAIYAGQITNWAQVGGEDKEIVPFQRNENAGSQTAMKSLVMKGQEMVEPEMLEIGTMSGLLEAVASYNNDASALGYSYYYYANLMYRTPGLRFMAVDGVMPSNEMVQKGEYPYIAQYYAAIRSDEPEGTPARRIYEWLTTRQGQELAADLGYIPLDESVKPQMIHTDETAEEPIPIGEDQRFAVKTGSSTVVFLDREGKVTERFENAALAKSSEDTILGFALDAQVFDIDEPIPIAIKTGDDEFDDYKVGLYSLRESRWLLEPEYYYMTPLGDKLCTDSNIMNGGGDLMRLDGTVIAQTEQFAFTRQGDYIVSDKQIFDLEGNELCTIDGFIRLWQEDKFVVAQTDGTTVYQDVYGHAYWAEASGLHFKSFCGDYINWSDANGVGIITDQSLQMVMNDAVFWQMNPEYAGTGTDMSAVLLSPDGSQILVKVTNPNWRNEYLICDNTFKIIEKLPGDRIEVIQNMSEQMDNEVSVWMYQMEDGILRFERLWSDEEILFTVDGDDEIVKNGVSLNYAQDALCVTMYDANWNTKSVFAANGKEVEEIDLESYTMAEIDNGIVALYEADWMTGETDRVFCQTDGTILCGGNGIRALYAGEDFRCVQYGSYIYIEDYNGLLYVRLLASDEEIEELEGHNFWEE